MKNHVTCSRQQGISSLGFLLILGLASFFLLLIFKIGPLYLDNSFVSAALNKMENEQLDKLTNYQVRKKFADHLRINSVYDVSSKDLEIKRTPAKVLLIMDYEKRINLLGNLDVVVVFENHYDSSTPKE